MKTQIEIHSSCIMSTQEWAADPSLILVVLTADDLAKAEKCHAFLVENRVSTMLGIGSVSYEFYEPYEAGNLDHNPEDILEIGEGRQFVVFNPEYTVEGCELSVRDDGTLRGIFDFKHTPEYLEVDLGKIEDLRQRFND